MTEKTRILERLEIDDLTFELGVETAEAGIGFDYMPYRCLTAREFKKGFISASNVVVRDDLTTSSDGRIIRKNIN